MATVFEEALETLNNAQKDKIELEHLDDGTVNIHILSFQKTETKTEEVSGKSKWAQFADDMAKANYLEGMSEEVNKYAREFRDSFSFERGE